MAPETPLPTNWFGPPPEMLEGERWVANFAANRTQGKRAVGGALHVTTHRLLFCANVVDARLGGKAWSCALGDVTAVGVEPPRRFALTELFSGALSARLRIDLRQGRELFVVASPADVEVALRGMLPAEVATARADLPAAKVVTRPKRD